MEESLKKRIQFAAEIDRLKQVLRVNLLQDGSRRENTAEHSWHMSVLTIMFADQAEEKIDLLRAVKMALLHDVVEVDAGDTYAFDKDANNDKWEREKKAADRLFGLLPKSLGDEFHNLWMDYEELSSPEARFIAAMDRLSPLLQHLGNQGKTWKEKKMTRSRLMTRIGDLARYCPKLKPFVEESLDTAVANGWLLPD